LKVRELGECTEREEGEEKKEGREGETYEGLLRGTVREERGRYQLFCKFRGLLIPLQRLPPWSCWLVMNLY